MFEVAVSSFDDPMRYPLAWFLEIFEGDASLRVGRLPLI